MFLPPLASKKVSKELILALKLDDVIGQEPRDPIGSPLGPAWFHITSLVAQGSLQCQWKFRAELLEEFGEIGLQPVDRLIGTADKQQKKVSTRCRAACLKYAQRFAQRGRAITLQHPPQSVLVQPCIHGDFAFRTPARFHRSGKQPRQSCPCPFF